MKLVIPNEIRYGLQERYDTYTKKLGYMIYANKPNGTYGQQVSFDGWRDKKITPKDIGNEYQLGFVLNKGHLNKYHFGASAKFRVFHPEGFEFEISLENLSLLLDNSVISYGEIQVPCCISWDGSNVYLLPQVDMKGKVEIEYFDVHQNKNKAEKRLEKINSSGKPLSARSLTSGKIVEDAKGNRFAVVSYTKSNFHRDPLMGYRIEKDNNDFIISSSKGHAYSPDFNPDFEKMFYPLTEISGVVGKNKVNEFYKFVQEEDLSVNEAKNLKKLKEVHVLQFNQEQKFVPLNKNEVDGFIDHIIKKYKDVKLADYNNQYGKVIILNQVVKIEGRLYHVVVGHNYRFGYGSYALENEMKPFDEKQKKISKLEIKLSYFCRAKTIEVGLIPFTSEKNEYAGLNTTIREYKSIYLQILEDSNIKEYHDLNKERLSAIKIGIANMIEPLDQSDVDAQKRLYWD